MLFVPNHGFFRVGTGKQRRWKKLGGGALPALVSNIDGKDYEVRYNKR
jgi:hypothetical protein